MSDPQLQVRRSFIHGDGVFAIEPLAAGDVVIDYGGELISWEEADLRHEQAAGEPGHTFLFDVGEGLVIDGGRRGNVARWINHGCEPNCAAEVVEHRVVITALRDIHVGEELLLDYQLVVDDDLPDGDRVAYACRCGARSCRTTMLRVADAC